MKYLALVLICLLAACSEAPAPKPVAETPPTCTTYAQFKKVNDEAGFKTIPLTPEQLGIVQKALQDVGESEIVDAGYLVTKGDQNLLAVFEKGCFVDGGPIDEDTLNFVLGTKS